MKNFLLISQGLYSEVSGPTLPYLKERSDSNFEQISRALVARSVGFLSGAVAGQLYQISRALVVSKAVAGQLYQISRALVARSVGFLSGAVTGQLYFDTSIYIS